MRGQRSKAKRFAAESGSTPRACLNACRILRRSQHDRNHIFFPSSEVHSVGKKVQAGSIGFAEQKIGIEATDKPAAVLRAGKDDRSHVFSRNTLGKGSLE